MNKKTGKKYEKKSINFRLAFFRAVQGPFSSELHGMLLKIKILDFHPGPTESCSLGLDIQIFRSFPGGSCAH